VSPVRYELGFIPQKTALFIASHRRGNIKSYTIPSCRYTSLTDLPKLCHGYQLCFKRLLRITRTPLGREPQFEKQWEDVPDASLWTTITAPPNHPTAVSRAVECIPRVTNERVWRFHERFDLLEAKDLASPKALGPKMGPLYQP
jgi:hypothetical protein